MKMRHGNNRRRKEREMKIKGRSGRENEWKGQENKEKRRKA